MRRKFLQYNIWKNCNNNCSFCFNRGGSISTIEEQISDLKYLYNELSDHKTDEFNEIGFIGGEFFDNQIDDSNVKKEFYCLIDECARRHNEGLLDKFYIATSLIYDFDKHLTEFIDYLKKTNLLEITLFCTSYDLKYRFHTQKQIDLWKMNMKKLYAIINKPIHVEIILSQFFIDAILNDSFDVVKFKNEYNAYIDYIEPTFIAYFKDREDTIKAMPDFFPKREQFFKFVDKTVFKDKTVDINNLLSIYLRSDTSYYKLKDGSWLKFDNRWESDIRRVDEFGNPVKIYSYCDSDVKMTDDAKMIAEMVN